MNEDMEHVWGIMSHDDLSGSREATLYTMNDLDLIYWKETDDYTVDIETVYDFDGRQAVANYLTALLEGFTKWMEEKGYSTDTPVSLYHVFSEDNGHYKTIELAYAHFKLKVLGWLEHHDIANSEMVRYRWSEDGASELCSREDFIATSPGLCYHCDNSIPVGSEATVLRPIGGGYYRMHRACADRGVEHE